MFLVAVVAASAAVAAAFVFALPPHAVSNCGATNPPASNNPACFKKFRLFCIALKFKSPRMYNYIFIYGVEE